MPYVFRIRPVSAALLLTGLVVLGPAHAAEDTCQCRDLTVHCEIRPPGPILVGEPFEFCAIVTAEGNHPVENVRVRLQLCDGLVVHSGCDTSLTIPRLAPGETRTHCVRVSATFVGPCRNLAHAADETGIAAAGCWCETEITGLPALQLEMIDLDVQGSPQGIFRVGDMVVYDVKVEEDRGSASANGLTVDWRLPPELEFVHGEGGRGTTVTGSGRTAQSSQFSLGREEVQTFRITARVLEAAPRGWVQTEATVRTVGGGQVLAMETESTTLRR